MERILADVGNGRVPAYGMTNAQTAGGIWREYDAQAAVGVQLCPAFGYGVRFNKVGSDERTKRPDRWLGYSFMLYRRIHHKRIIGHSRDGRGCRKHYCEGRTLYSDYPFLPFSSIGLAAYVR